MRDNSNHFDDAVACSAAHRAAIESAEDRRRSPRAAHRVVIDIHPVMHDGVGAPVAVVLVDLSLVGMGVIHSAAMPRGSRFEIPLTRGGDNGRVERQALPATVVRCEQLDDGLFNIGFEFNSSAAAVDEASRQLTGRPALREE